MRKISISVFRVLTYFVLFIVVTNVLGSEDKPVEKRIANLEMQVSDLNSRILQLEKQLSDCANVNTPSIQNVPADKAAWRKLKKDMSKDQVKQLLGEPVTIHRFDSFEVWNYNKYSNVQFDDDGNVTGWREPE